jgi:hypothetical protein
MRLTCWRLRFNTKIINFIIWIKYWVCRLNGTHQLLAYADDGNLLGDNIDNTKKNTESLIDTSKEFGLEINLEKTQ